jgi:hypothetical protein
LITPTKRDEIYPFDYTNFLMKTKSTGNKFDWSKIARSLSISPMPSRKLQIAELISEVSIKTDRKFII